MINITNQWNTGAYKWTNLVNGRVYVGGAYVSFDRRYKEHLNALRNNKHINKWFQNSWNKHGENNFKFEILERCPPEKVIEVEQKWLDFHKAGNRLYTFNASTSSRNPKGFKHTKKFKERVSETSRKMWKDPDIRARIVAKFNNEEFKKASSKRSKELWKTDSHKKKMKKAHKKRCQDPEERARLRLEVKKYFSDPKNREKKSNCMKEMWRDPEYKRRMVEAHKGQVPSTKAIENARKKTKGVPLTEEHKRKIALGHIGKKHTEETKRRISELLTGYKQSQETKDKRAASNRGQQRTEEQKRNIKEGIRRGIERRKQQAVHGLYHKAPRRKAGALV